MTQTFMQAEIESQPEHWRAVAGDVRRYREMLPASGERVVVVGCGTSWYMAQSYAALREARGHGITDSFAASEMPLEREYDRVLAITRSGTTTELLRVLEHLAGRVRTTVFTGAPEVVAGLAGHVVGLSDSDEKSVVQTRFATTCLALLRAHLGEDMFSVAAQAESVLADAVGAETTDARQHTFLGTGWTIGLAHEAALKVREAALGWSESYPAMEYRHGPIGIAEKGRVVWMFGRPPAGLAEEVQQTGARFVHRDVDPLADLVGAQRLALEMAHAHGLDPDQPRNLARSVVLEQS